MPTLTAQPHTDACPDDARAFAARVVAEVGGTPECVIPLLQAIQAHYRYLPDAVLREVCAISEITPAQITGVASFYTHFRLRPIGRHLIRICHGTACHVKGAEQVTQALRRHLGLAGEADTDADGLFTVQPVACLGCCTLAPVLQIDGVTYGHLTPDGVPGVLADFLALAQQGAVAPASAAGPAPAGLAEIRIGVGSCCVAGGSQQVRAALEAAVHDLGAPVAVKPVGCVGMCHQTPLVEVAPPDAAPTLYARVTPDEAGRIVRRHFKPAGLRRTLATAATSALERLLTDAAWTPVTRYALDVREAPVCEFLGRQQHLATEYAGCLDPLDLEAYLAHDGFAALHACDEMTPEAIIETITASGLRGRGGAGFPTGRKWALVRAAAGGPKVVIANGDEGDPGAFMDRMLLESYPYRVLEGLAITARAVGAAEAILYIRHEYPLAVRRIREALRRCAEGGLLGDLDVRVAEGAGAFVCGEETALIAALEGRRGTPTLRPPYPAERGLHGRPTAVNNTETLALVPWILRHGAAAFRAFGTPDSPGTKVFALAGAVARGGLIEVPMGITLRQIVEEIGGGVADGRTFKAVQIGGPSGGCLPARLADTPVDYETLATQGAIMGSGGLVVIDDRTCMVDLARYFLRFTQRESCGQCTFCRVGTRRLLEILDRLCTGHGRTHDLAQLEELAGQVQRGSLCGLGQTAPNPVLSTLRHFRDEYEAHLAGRCPAGVCPALITYRVTEACIGCTKCAQACPADAIPLTPFTRHAIDPAACTRCDTCRRVCPTDAIVVV